MDGGLPSPDEITRYDFLDGAAVAGRGLATAPAPPTSSEAAASPWPPGRSRTTVLTRPGREGTGFARLATRIEHFDCVIVGGGAGGMAAADSYRDRFGQDTRILILEALGHASGHAAAGGPGGAAFAAGHGLRSVLLFDRADFGTDAVVVDRDERAEPDTAAGWRRFLARTPYDPAAVASILRVQTEARDFLGTVHGGLDVPARIALLSRLSYRQYLVDYLRTSPQAVLQYQRTSNALLGAGIAAVSAADMWLLGAPGFDGLGLGDPAGTAPSGPPAPDGVGPAATTLDQAARDLPGDAVRLRLNSRVIKVRPAVRSRGGLADVLYVPNGAAGGTTAHLVRASHVIMACWDRLTAQIVDGLPLRQLRGLTHAPTAPVIHGRAELRNWRAFADAGIGAISPRGNGTFWDGITLAVGRAAPGTAESGPDAPATLRFTVVPADAEQEVGAAWPRTRDLLLGRSFAELEGDLLDMIQRTVNSVGGDFQPARDVSEITINRWRHGYAHGMATRTGRLWVETQGPRAGGGRRQPLRNVAIADGRVGAFGHAHAASVEGRRAVWDLPVPAGPYWERVRQAD